MLIGKDNSLILSLIDMTNHLNWHKLVFSSMGRLILLNIPGCPWLIACDLLTYLITVSMSSNHNWLYPSRNQSWNLLANDWLTKNCTTQDVTNCTIRTAPHLLQVEFWNKKDNVWLIWLLLNLIRNLTSWWFSSALFC